VVQTPRIHISVGEAEHDTDATLITDPEQVRRVVDDFTEKYGASRVARSYPNPEVAVRVELS